MDSPSELEAHGQEHKITSFVRHRRLQRKAERALSSMPLGKAINQGMEKLYHAKDQHEQAAAIIRGDLNPPKS